MTRTKKEEIVNGGPGIKIVETEGTGGTGREKQLKEIKTGNVGIVPKENQVKILIILDIVTKKSCYQWKILF